MKTEASAVATTEHHQQILQVGNGKRPESQNGRGGSLNDAPPLRSPSSPMVMFLGDLGAGQDNPEIVLRLEREERGGEK